MPQALFQNQRTVAQSRIAKEDQSRQRQNYLCVPAFARFSLTDETVQAEPVVSRRSQYRKY